MMSQISTPNKAAFNMQAKMIFSKKEISFKQRAETPDDQPQILQQIKNRVETEDRNES